MTREPYPLDLTALQATWRARNEALREILRRFDVRGLQRPSRDPDEQEWLEENRGSWFTEDARYESAARAYYARRYQK